MKAIGLRMPAVVLAVAWGAAALAAASQLSLFCIGTGGIGGIAGLEAVAQSSSGSIANLYPESFHLVVRRDSGIAGIYPGVGEVSTLTVAAQ